MDGEYNGRLRCRSPTIPDQVVATDFTGRDKLVMLLVDNDYSLVFEGQFEHGYTIVNRELT